MEFFLNKSFQQDEMAHFDELTMIKNNKKISVFASEGRNIETVLFPDLDKDNRPEILVIMDLGGSGGYKELTLLKNDGQGYKQVWEYSGFAGAKVKIINNNENGTRQILINYLNKLPDGKEKPERAVFFWGDNGLQERAD
jgi:hypothetical protein